MKNLKLRYLFWVLIIGALGLFSGCKVLNPSVMFQTEKSFDFNGFEAEQPEYVIRPFDKLDVRIYTNDGIQLIDMGSGNTNLTDRTVSPYLVEHDSIVKVPTIGRVKVAGLTIKQTEALFEQKYSQYYQKPFVLVNVTNRRVVVFSAGSVNGTVLPIENERFTLVEALAQAGGIDDYSKAFRIKLLRGSLDNPQVFMFDISSIEEMRKANLVLQANDIIYVEQRPRYAYRTLNEIMPYITLLNTFLLLGLTITAL